MDIVYSITDVLYLLSLPLASIIVSPEFITFAGKRMRIAILGTFVLDEIYDLNRIKTESLGGISYSLAILSNLLGDDDSLQAVRAR